jgi:chromosome partitioning protein
VSGASSPGQRMAFWLQSMCNSGYKARANQRNTSVPEPLVVAMVSQKGGVGKSTLIRGLATFAVSAGWKTQVADLDEQQKSAVVWNATRKRENILPSLDVEAFTAAKEAMAWAKTADLLLLDTPGKITDGATQVSQFAHLLVQPTSPSADDLHIAVLVFLAMERVGVSRDKLAFALCRVLAASEEKYARSYLPSFGYAVLQGSIQEQLEYREAMRAGRSITETNHETLDASAKALMTDILRAAETNVGQKTAAVENPPKTRRKK